MSPVLHGLLVVVALVLLWGGIGLSLWRERHFAEQNAVDQSRNLVRAFSENIIRTIGAVDQVLLLVRDAYARDPAGFDLNSWATNRAFLNEFAIQISLVDRKGLLMQSNLGRVSKRVDLSDRAHIRVHFNTTEDRLFISDPLLGRLSGKWSIQFTRKLLGADGGFAGVAVISLDPYYLSRFYESLRIGNGAVLLASKSGVVLASAPQKEGVIGAQISSRLRGDLLGGATSGTFVAVSDSDGIERIVSFAVTEGFPLVVALGLATDDIYAGYRQNTVIYGCVGAAITLGLVLVGLMLMRQRNRMIASRQALKATLENISQGIMMIEADGRVPVINRRAFDLLGLPPSLRPRHLTFRDILDWRRGTAGAGATQTQDELLLVALRQGIGLERELRDERIGPDGIVLEVNTQCLPGGGAVRTLTDVTERKRTEAVLAAARDATEAASRAQSEFLAVISHEIRTPLNGILGVSSLLLDMPLDPIARKYMQVVRESGNHLLQLINDVLDFSKLDAGKLELEDVQFDLRAAIGGAVDLMTAQAREKGLAIGALVDSNVPRQVRGDPGRLRQVLLNLIGNGIKFTVEGSVEVRVGVGPSESGVVKMICSVIDTGIGIPAGKMGRLFERFSQVDSSVSRQFGGTGLGLAICRKLVEQMGGSIGVDSTPGKGSTFHFHILLKSAPQAAETAETTGATAGPSGGGQTPAMASLANRLSPPAEASAEPAATPPAPTLAGVRCHILLAEDNATNRMVVTRMLERRGHRVDCVENGQQAVEAVRAGEYDVVLMDMMMPEMDGLAATRCIRALDTAAAGVPVIGLTANVLTTDKEACLAAGMSGFLTKPVTTDQLAHAIDDVMASRPAPALSLPALSLTDGDPAAEQIGPSPEARREPWRDAIVQA